MDTIITIAIVISAIAYLGYSLLRFLLGKSKPCACATAGKQCGDCSNQCGVIGTLEKMHSAVTTISEKETQDSDYLKQTLNT